MIKKPTQRLTIMETVETVDGTADGAFGRLRPDALAAIRQAQLHEKPLLIRCSLSADEAQLLEAEWCNFVGVNSRVKLQRPDAGLMQLGTIWKSAERAETGLPDALECNLVQNWLSGAPSGSMAAKVWRVQTQVNTLALLYARTLPNTPTPTYPAFIAGLIPEGGGPTHYDDYDNLAMVYCGSKTFYMAQYAQLSHLDVEEGMLDKDGLPNPLRGRPNERLDISPLTARTDISPVWQSARLQPGDILVLPHRMWHWVYTTPHSVMGNVWV